MKKEYLLTKTENKCGGNQTRCGMKQFVNKLFTAATVLLGLFMLWIALQITCIATFKVPSNSMEPTLLPGDNIAVNKWIMGGRIFNVFDAIDGKEVKISRFPHFGKVIRNDILVFNYPYPNRRDSISFDVMKYFVKRCVALPGDTFEIKNAHYKVHGYNRVLGNSIEQKTLESILKLDNGKRFGIATRSYPRNKIVDWNILNFGPLYIPAKGSCITMSTLHAVLYKNAIEWEQKKKLHIEGQHVLLGDSVIYRYRFKENYYFVTGDKAMNSQDSRYWGLLPEPFIVGKAVRIWKSVNKETEKIRWDRVFKRIE